MEATTVTITPEAAELRIGYLCRHIDQVRASTRPDDQKAVLVAQVEAEVAELVKITGPRKAVGLFRCEMPLPQYMRPQG